MGEQAAQDSQTAFVEHPRIKDEALESRTYQEVIAASALDQNTLVVLPTGLGKTAVAMLLAAHRLEEHPGSKILVLAPTRPLVEQHRDEFERCVNVDTEIYEVLTGDTRPEKREEVWKEVGAFFATPQVVENDIINGRLDLDEFSLVVFDEVHRASGDYPYTFIAKKYVDAHADNEGTMETGRVLGLTASPGGDREKIERIADTLNIQNFEIRTEDDPDVKPYIQEKNTNWVKVDLTDHFKRVKRHLNGAERTRLKQLKKLGLLDSVSNVKKTDMLKLRSELGARMKKEDDPDLYQGMSHVAAVMKIQHAEELLESQGVKPLYQFFEKMKKDQSTKAARTLLNDEDFQNAVAVTEWMYNNGKEHPKLAELKDLLSKELEDGKNAMVFTQFRDTVDLLVERLDDVAHLEPEAFKGQKGDFTQKKQLEILDQFRDDAFNVLVSTSVGEEGLDVPAVDYVIFYEPIPSEVRSIQRRGRTGRQEAGEIYVFMAKNTRDEGYYWSAKNKEKQMKQVMHDLRDDPVLDSRQETLESVTGKAKDTVAASASDADNTNTGGDGTGSGADKDSGEPTGQDETVDNEKAQGPASQDAVSTEEAADASTGSSAGQRSLDGFSGDADNIVVYADDRENKVMKDLSKKDIAVRSTRLDIGDFLVSDRTVVERKRADDFVSSLIDNRLFPQLQTMVEEFSEPVMIIEGDDLFAHRNVHPNAIRGALSSIVLDYNVPLLWAQDRSETVELLIALAKREQEDNDRSVQIRGEKQPKTENELQKFIVAGLPNVSDKLADRLLQEFGSVRSIFTASETELKNVEGIGAEKASRIKDILEREYTGTGG